MSKFQIIVVNDSSLQKNFTIFNDFPQKSTNKGEPRQNVWAVSPLVNSAGGSTTFSITENYYAVCGMSPRKIAEGVEVSSQNQVSVILSSNTSKGTMVPMEAKSAGVFFDKGKLGQDNTPGTYKIETASWDTGEYELAFLGLGRDNPTPNPPIPVTPVAVIPAEPSSKYFLTPTRKFYISTGKIIEGTVVLIKQLGQIATIDFTGRSENLATVHVLKDLTFGPIKYSTNGGG